MPLVQSLSGRYSDNQGNSIDGVPEVTGSIKIHFKSANCQVFFDEDVRIEHGFSLTMSGFGGEVWIGKGSTLRGLVMRTGPYGKISIGKKLYMTNGGIFSASEASELTIGEDCMFAAGITLRTDDAHPIFDRATGNRLNKTSSVSIGDHVWLAPEVAVLPGAKVGEGSVIGMRSVVTGDIPAHSLAIGVPARVFRQNIVWDKQHVSEENAHTLTHIDLLSRPAWTPKQSGDSPSESGQPKLLTRLWKKLRREN